jgi:hypothetical protein
VTGPDRPRLTARDLTSREKGALVFQTAVLVGGPADLAVALIRFARRERGVQLGPTLVSLVLAAGAPPVGRWAVRHQGRLAAAALLGYGGAIVLAPAAAAPVRVTVVGSGQPLWQLAVAAAARALSASVTALLVVRRLTQERRLSGA